MLKFEIAGDGQTAIQYIYTAKDRALRGIRTGMRQGMVGLAGYIVAQKLSGQVLNRGTGRLADAVIESPRVWQGPDYIKGSVNAKPKGMPNEGYWQEFGTKAIEGELMRMALTADTYTFTRRRRAVGPRPFMNPSLAEYKSQILGLLAENLERAMQ